MRRCSGGVGAASRFGAVPSSTALAPCSMPMCIPTACSIEGVVEADGASGARFYETRGVGPDTIADIQAQAAASR